MVFTHHWDQAIEQLRYAIDLDPNYWFDYFFLGQAYEQKGRLAEAIETFQKGLKLEQSIELLASLGHAYALSGNAAEARKVLDHLAELSHHAYIAPHNFAVIYAGLGENDRAFESRSYLLSIT